MTTQARRDMDYLLFQHAVIEMRSYQKKALEFRDIQYVERRDRAQIKVDKMLKLLLENTFKPYPKKGLFNNIENE